MTVFLTVLLSVMCLVLWREAWIAHHHDRDGDSSGVFLAIGSMFAYGALLTSGMTGI